MNRTWMYAGLAAVCGFLVAIAWRVDAPPAGERPQAAAASREAAMQPSMPAAIAPAQSAGSDIGELRRRLDDEVRARRELEDEVAALRRQLDELQVLGESSAARLQQAQSEAADSGVDSANGWFDEQALIDSGMDGALAGELKDFYERLEFERLQLRDRAAREGWDRARRRDGFEALDERERQLRERLGDSGYDAYLYAAGRPNRVAVTSVLASAPAAQAGIQAGDYILRYDNERIYDWSDLRAATTAGDLGDPVALEVERGGKKLQVYLSRGPLGVRTDSRSVAP